MQRFLRQSSPPAAEPTGPPGVTLTEVLMSLMIMSIGVSAVAVLFPISVLRSVQATQMTNAAILKLNTEALVRMRPDLIFDPDGDASTNAAGVLEHVSSPLERRYIVDPGGYFAMTDAGAPFSTDPTHTSTARAFADWFGNVDTNYDGVPEAYDPSVAGRTPLPRFDGGLRWGTRSGPRPNGLIPNPNTNPEEARALQHLAASLSKLGDGWLDSVDTTAEQLILADGSTVPVQGAGAAGPGASVAGVVLPNDIDLTAVPDGVSNVPRVGATQLIPDPELYRVVVYSVDGRYSVSLPIVNINGQGVIWTEDFNFDGNVAAGTNEDLNLNGVGDFRQLPLEMVDRTTGTFGIGRVLIQYNRPHDFNWLLTVRRGSDGNARGVDVVVTFNKSITPDDERLYSARFGQGSASAGPSGFEFFEESPPPAADQFRINVVQDGGLRADGDRAEPLLRRGGYVLDLGNGRWYRIQDYQKTKFDVSNVTLDGSFPPPANPIDGFIIRTETPIQGGVFTGKAMFLPGIVDVYPMGSLNLPPGFDL